MKELVIKKGKETLTRFLLGVEGTTPIIPFSFAFDKKKGELFFVGGPHFVKIVSDEKITLELKNLTP